MKATVKSGQSLLDIAIEYFGSWEALMDLAKGNDLSMTGTLTASSQLTLPEKTYDSRMQSWCKNNDVSPATAINN